MLGEGQAASEQRQVLIKPRRGKVCTCASAANRCKSRRDHYAFSLISNNLSGDLAITEQGPLLRPTIFPCQTNPLESSRPPRSFASDSTSSARLSGEIVRIRRSILWNSAIGNAACARSERTIRRVRFASLRSNSSIQVSRDDQEIFYKILWK